MRIKKTKKAQTFLEYALVISVVTAIMMAMSVLVRRSVQGMVKVVSDQIGFQQNADQNSRSGGYMVEMNVLSKRERAVSVRDRLGNITYTYDRDRVESQIFVLTNAGYTSGD